MSKSNQALLFDVQLSTKFIQQRPFAMMFLKHYLYVNKYYEMHETIVEDCGFYFIPLGIHLKIFRRWLNGENLVSNIEKKSEWWREEIDDFGRCWFEPNMQPFSDKVKRSLDRNLFEN